MTFIDQQFLSKEDLLHFGQQIDEQEKLEIERLKRELASAKSLFKHFTDLTTQLSTSSALTGDLSLSRNEAKKEKDKHAKLVEELSNEINRRELNLGLIDH